MSGKKSKRLSHSAVGKYQLCPKSYDFHYNQKLRPTTTSGALLFGSALDSAVNKLLDGKGLDEAFAVFEKSWAFGRIGSKVQALKENEGIVYAQSDLDLELLTAEDMAELGDNVAERVKEVLDLKKQRGWENLYPETKQWYNRANWLSMRRKGHLMLAAYSEKVIPHFKKVLAFQKVIKLGNDEGDSITGYIDLIAELNDGRVVIFDNKTSASEYEADSVLRSAQLALYMHAVYPEFKTRWAGYIVMRKGIIKNRSKICSQCGYEAEKGARHKSCTAEIKGKRCGGEWVETIAPEVDINIIIDEIPERTENLVLDNFADIAHLIDAGVFPRNLNNCDNVFGQPCPYKRYCWYGDKSGLEVDDDEGRK
jgi:hypothetical protein